MFAWVFFRCEQFGDAVYVLRAIISPLVFVDLGLNDITIWVIAIIGLDHYFGKTRKISNGAIAQSIGQSVWVVLGVITAVALTLVPLSQKAFIYFQF